MTTVDEAREALLDAVRAYGDARADVAYGRATRKAIDHAWDRLLDVAHIPPMDKRGESAETLRALREAARVVVDGWFGNGFDPAAFDTLRAALAATPAEGRTCVECGEPWPAAMTAYRIGSPLSSPDDRADDSGGTGAGQRLLHVRRRNTG